MIKIVVCGPPRSGTSWLMHKFKCLGMSVHGEQWPIFRDSTLQPFGYWECFDSLSGDLSKVLADVVKVSPRKLDRVDHAILAKAIVVVPCRQLRDIVASQERFGMMGRLAKQVRDEYQLAFSVTHIRVSFAKLGGLECQHIM